MKWENTFANHVSGKALGPRIYEELLQLNTPPQIIQLKNGLEYDLQMANEHMKGCSTSLIIRGIQI